MSDHVLDIRPSRAGYNAGCRCETCAAANREYMREYMRGAREREQRARAELSQRRAERRAEHRDRMRP